MRRRVVALGVLLAGAFAGRAFVRRSGARRERVDLFYDDGSLVTLADDEARPLLDTARSAFEA